MRRMWSLMLILLSITGMCACSQPNDKNDTAEDKPVNMTEEIAQMEEYAVGESESVSIATAMDENGELADYVDVSAADTYVETGKITEASLDLLKDVTGAFIDEQGNLLDGYSFVGVKLNIRSEKELNINTASFVLRGISNDEYFDASCFYQDGERTGTDVHEGGIAVVHPGTTELTVGFFADEEMMKCEKFLLIPTVIETEDSQNNYIEITIRKGN